MYKLLDINKHNS